MLNFFSSVVVVLLFVISCDHDHKSDYKPKDSNHENTYESTLEADTYTESVPKKQVTDLYALDTSKPTFLDENKKVEHIEIVETEAVLPIETTTNTSFQHKEEEVPKKSFWQVITLPFKNIYHYFYPQPTTQTGFKTKIAILGDSFAIGYLHDTRMGMTPKSNSPSFSSAIALHQMGVVSKSDYESIVFKTQNQYSLLGQTVWDTDAKSTLNLASNQDSIQTQASKVPKSIESIVWHIPYSDLCEESIDIDSKLQEDYKLIASKSSQVNIITPLHLDQIFELYTGDKIAFEPSFPFSAYKHTCAQLRDGAKYGPHTATCPLLLKQDGVLKFKKRYNIMLDTLNKLEHATILNSDIDFKPEYMAVDCFHLNHRGLKEWRQKLNLTPRV